MLNLLKSAWTGASDIVRVAIVIVVGALVALGIIYGVDVLPLLLSGAM